MRVPRLGLLLPAPVTVGGGPDEFGRLVALAAAAETSGFDGVWVHDGPPADGPSGDGAPLFEPYSLLGALAARTARVALAVLPDGPPVRHPAMMAKIVTGLDVISHGRAVLSLGTGPATDPEAVERLVEELEICRALLTEEMPTLEGRHYRITRAANRPAPVRRGACRWWWRPTGPTPWERRPTGLTPWCSPAPPRRWRPWSAASGSGPVRTAPLLADRCCCGRGRSTTGIRPAGSPPPTSWRRWRRSGAGGFVVDLGEGCDPGDVARCGEALAPVAARATATVPG